MKKYWLLSALVFSLAAPVTTAFAQTDPKPVTTKTVDGLTLKAVPVPTDEMRAMLETYLWRYGVKAPKQNTLGTLSLEFRQEGKTPNVLYEEEWYPLQDTTYSLALMPLPVAQSEWRTASKIKFYQRVWTTKEVSGGSGVREFDNPLKSLTIEAQSVPELMLFSPQGEAVLMEFTIDTDAGPKKASLVWTVHVSPTGEEEKK